MEQEKKLSTHKTEVIRINMTPHGNADSLSIVKIFDGYQAVVRTSDWQNGELAAYVVPDSIVDTTREEFSFLKTNKHDKERITVRRLRGQLSFGLLIKAPIGSKEGDDVSEQLGVTHYNPSISSAPLKTGLDSSPPPPYGFYPVYDVDNFRRYSNVFNNGEYVVITEKIDGTSAIYVCVDGEMYVSSHRGWKKKDEENLYWKILSLYPELEEFCRSRPGMAVYGEIYGYVQKLRYGASRKEVRFAAFDLLNKGEWLDNNIARIVAAKIPWVPLVNELIKFNQEYILEEAEKDSLVPGANHLREGVVVKPFQERSHPSIGRVNLKAISVRYLTQK